MNPTTEQAIRNVLGEDNDPSRPLTAEEAYRIFAEEDRLNAEAATATSTEISATGDPRKAPPVEVSPIKLAAEALMETGRVASEAEAYRMVAENPNGWNEVVERKTAEYQAAADAAAAAEYERSPAGLRERAEVLRTEQAEREQMLTDGRLILEAQGLPYDHLSEAEVLDHSGLVPSPERIFREQDERDSQDWMKNWVAANTPRNPDNSTEGTNS